MFAIATLAAFALAPTAHVHRCSHRCAARHECLRLLQAPPPPGFAWADIQSEAPAAVSASPHADWPARGGSGGFHPKSGPWPQSMPREQWVPPPGWTPPSKPVRSWYDAGIRLLPTPPPSVRSWYDRGVRLSAAAPEAAASDDDMLAAFRLKLEDEVCLLTAEVEEEVEKEAYRQAAAACTKALEVTAVVEVQVTFQGSSKYAIVAAAATTDVLYDAAAQLHGLARQGLRLILKGCNVPLGVPMSEFAAWNSQNDWVLVIAAPAMKARPTFEPTVEQIYGKRRQTMEAADAEATADAEGDTPSGATTASTVSVSSWFDSGIRLAAEAPTPRAPPQSRAALAPPSASLELLAAQAGYRLVPLEDRSVVQPRNVERELRRRPEVVTLPSEDRRPHRTEAELATAAAAAASAQRAAEAAEWASKAAHCATEAARLAAEAAEWVTKEE